MRNLARLACFGAALALVLGLSRDVGAGKPGSDEPKTQACTLTGDATGGGVVGIDAKSYGPLTMFVETGALAAVFNSAQGPEPEQNSYPELSVPKTFEGQGRVLKRQGRMDFAFNSDSTACRVREWEEEPGPNLDPEVCQYELLIAYGVYDRKADEVTFTAGGNTAQLFDNRIPVGEGMLIGEGTASLLVDF